MDTARKLFGMNLAKLCDRQGFGRKDLAESLNVQQTMVSRWIAGGTLPTKHLDAIARYLAVDVKDLFALPSEPTPLPPKLNLTPIDALKIVAKDYGYSLKRQ